MFLWYVFTVTRLYDMNALEKINFLTFSCYFFVFYLTIYLSCYCDTKIYEHHQTLNWDLPHGHTLQARCEDLGLYKLVGEAKVLCSNGLWAPKLPQCVPTTLLTNYSDDSPPSIRIKVGVGSAAYEPSGFLAVLPGSTLHLDCMYPRRKGSPEWTWTGWFRQYLTGK
jgi:hypothetical protein